MELIFLVILLNLTKNLETFASTILLKVQPLIKTLKILNSFLKKENNYLNKPHGKHKYKEHHIKILISLVIKRKTT